MKPREPLPDSDLTAEIERLKADLAAVLDLLVRKDWTADAWCMVDVPACGGRARRWLTKEEAENDVLEIARKIANRK